MTSMRMPRVSGLAIAVVGLIGGAGAVVVELARAIQVDEGRATVAPAIAIPTYSLPQARPAAVKIDDDPFSADRAPPATRYRLNGGPRAPAAPPMMSPAIDLAALIPNVHGMVIGPDGSRFVTCSINGGPLKHLKVGDSIGEYTVETIERGHVTFVTRSGRRVDVRTT